MNESVIYLPEVDSTNLWAKQNLDKFGPVGAVYSTHQTAGRGRLGRSWTAPALPCRVCRSIPPPTPSGWRSI